MTLDVRQLTVMTPYRYKSRIIYFTDLEFDFTRRDLRVTGYYLTKKQMERELKFKLIPNLSIRDGTYRSVAERRHIVRPKPRFIKLDNRKLRYMSLM